MKKKELAFINVLRFIGAVSIAIFLHYYDHLLPNLNGNFNLTGNQMIQYVFKNSFVFVEMFFMISGILFSVSYKKKIEDGEKIDNFILKRYKRIFPLVIFSTVFMYIANYFFYRKFKIYYSCGSINLVEFIYDIFFAGTISIGTNTNPINGPLWYIGPLMICYCIAYFITVFNKNKKSKLVYIVPILIGTSILLCNYNFFIFNSNVARGLVAFFTGCIIFDESILNKIKEFNKRKKIIFRICMILIMIFVMNILIFKDNSLYVGNNTNNSIIYVFLIFTPLFYLLYDFKWINKICDSSFFKFLGNISYSIYVWNFPILIVLTYMIKSKWLNINIESWKFIFLNFVIHMIVATISYYFIEEKIKKFLNKKEKKIMENYNEKYNQWINSNLFDEKTKQELKSIEGNEKEIEDRFYKDLEFGTGGLRGVIGAGTNRMNIYTVRKATQGLANYIIKQNAKERGVVIAYDSRNMSIEFSEEVALCLNANGIKSYRFDSLRPTPELSFAVRKLNCIAGIVITASHNPPEYNGYKVYWEDGGQIVPPHDKEIITEVNNIDDYSKVYTMKKDEAIEKGLYNIVGKEVDDEYIDELKKLVLNPEDIKSVADSIKIVYTPLHGTGNLPVQRILKELGFNHVYVVPEQEKPDGNFPTVSYPNPEDPKAFELALKLAKEVDADIVLATDPDADRLGVYAKDTKTGEYMSFTGNMSGLLIAEYELSEKRNKGMLPEKGALVKTIVSSNMANEIVKEYNIKLIEVLTGFKYIGEQIKLFEENKSYNYLFGYEESYGCLIGTYARDKDAISAVMALCEAAAFYKNRGLTLWDQMINIYKKYGYYKEGLSSITLKGVEGVKQIQTMMEKLRNEKIDKIGEWKVLAIRDYEKGIRIDCSGKEEKLELPKSNVLYYELDNDAWVCVRPSGTEPKIKFYMGVVGCNIEDSDIKLNQLKELFIKLVNNN